MMKIDNMRKAMTAPTTIGTILPSFSASFVHSHSVVRVEGGSEGGMRGRDESERGREGGRDE